MTRAVRELGEDKLLVQVFPRLNRNSRVVIGAGDDCAVVKFHGAKDWLLLKTDCVVEEVHFARETSAGAVGWKAMMRALSDFAAMSGIPEFALITLAIAGKKKASWVGELYRGLNRAAARFDVAIVGGETSETIGPTVIVVSVAGGVERDRCVLRSGGKANGDTGKQAGSGIELRRIGFVFGNYGKPGARLLLRSDRGTRRHGGTGRNDGNFRRGTSSDAAGAERRSSAPASGMRREI